MAKKDQHTVDARDEAIKPNTDLRGFKNRFVAKANRIAGFGVCIIDG